MKTFAISVVSIAVILVAVGCGNEAETPAPSSATAPSAALPADLVVAEAPAGAQDVAAVKKAAKDGDAIVIRGKVAGQEEPLAKNRAMMTILDPAVKTCDTIPGDACKTPWDACCEPAETIAANSASVQVVDANGKPLEATLQDVAGMRPLSKVTISGIARRPAGSETLIVEAKEIHVVP